MKKADRIYYGGDYNPDQWDDQTIDEDMRIRFREVWSLERAAFCAWNQ